MLILLNEQYVAAAHIVQIAAHPVARAVCIILTTGAEIRFEMGDRESKAEAVARIGRLVMSKMGA